jgi:hypothetical protein
MNTLSPLPEFLSLFRRREVPSVQPKIRAWASHYFLIFLDAGGHGIARIVGWRTEPGRILADTLAPTFWGELIAKAPAVVVEVAEGIELPPNATQLGENWDSRWFVAEVTNKFALDLIEQFQRVPYPLS